MVTINCNIIQQVTGNAHHYKKKIKKPYMEFHVYKNTCTKMAEMMIPYTSNAQNMYN
jgi:hypothetical protein